MNHNFKQCYKINRTSVEKSFSNQLGLKMNPEYECWADNVGLEILKYFTNKYSGLEIEIPKIREKSSKSLLGKIKNLQIERLSKLYALEGIKENDKRELYSLIEERIYENQKLDSIQILKIIKELINNNIDNIDIEELQTKIMVDGISKSTKTALLRILVSKLENSTLSNKKEILEMLDNKYGEKASIKSGIVENDIIRYSSIIKIKNDKQKIERLRDEKKFLKANDLRGMKIVVADISDDFVTDNEVINQLLQKRMNTTNKQERIKYTHLCIVEIGKEFYKDLANNEELLESLNTQVIPNSNKHKKKSNGYEAQHIKFLNTDNPEYTLELQFKSEYVETICKSEGTASHENRPGKARILPDANSNEELIKKLEYMVPRYKVFVRDKDDIKIEKFNMLKNVIGYFQGQILPNSEEYEKIINLLAEVDIKQKEG